MASHVSKSLFRQKDVGRRTDTLRPVSLRGSLAVCGVHLPRGGHDRGTDSRWDPLVTYVPTEGKEQQAPGFKYLSVYRFFFLCDKRKGCPANWSCIFVVGVEGSWSAVRPIQTPTVHDASAGDGTNT